MAAMSDYLESGIIDHLLRTITFSKPSNISIALLRNHDANWEYQPKRNTPLQQLPGDKGREHGHLALRKIKMINGLIDHDHGQSDTGINRAIGQTTECLLEK